MSSEVILLQKPYISLSSHILLILITDPKAGDNRCGSGLVRKCLCDLTHHSCEYNSPVSTIQLYRLHFFPLHFLASASIPVHTTTEQTMYPVDMRQHPIPPGHPTPASSTNKAVYAVPVILGLLIIGLLLIIILYTRRRTRNNNRSVWNE